MYFTVDSYKRLLRSTSTGIFSQFENSDYSDRSKSPADFRNMYVIKHESDTNIQLTILLTLSVSFLYIQSFNH